MRILIDIANDIVIDINKDILMISLMDILIDIIDAHSNRYY